LVEAFWKRLRRSGVRRRGRESILGGVGGLVEWMGVGLSMSIYSKVEMGVGGARLGRKRRRRWRASRDVNYVTANMRSDGTFTTSRYNSMANESEVCRLCM